jgi:peptidoglycan/LPS O-acetylase OafA/YrhL
VRVRSLDGLRGFAAFAVVLCHSLLSSQLFYHALFIPVHPSRFSVSWWLTRPPLNLLWSGQQAVVIFFVLSGLVVSLPFVRDAAAPVSSWVGYYPRRLVRLYVPVWAAVGLAALIATAVKRHGIDGGSEWVLFHNNPDWAGVRRDVTLVHGTDGLNGPLWTLRWEVIFSLLLPGYVVFARVARRASLVKVLLMLDLVAVGVHTGHETLTYLPLFGTGAALAGDLDGVRRLGEWLTRHRLAALALVIISLALLDLNAIRLLFGPASLHDATTLVSWGAGATLLVVLVLVAAPVRRGCESRVGQWLGRQSFSLYLVHEPIVVSVAILFGPNTSIYLVAAVGVPLAVAASWLFQRLVEGPAHDLSRYVGRTVTGWAAGQSGRVDPTTRPGTPRTME